MSQQANYGLRIGYCKQGKLVFLAASEANRGIEQLLRRSKLPLAVRSKPSPVLRINFGSALPIGVGGTQEFFDVYLTAPVDPQDALLSLQKVCTPDLMVYSCERIEQDASLPFLALPFSTYRAVLSYAPEQINIPEHVIGNYTFRDPATRNEEVRHRVLQTSDFLAGDVSLCGTELSFVLKTQNAESLPVDVFVDACCALSTGEQGDESEKQYLKIIENTQKVPHDSTGVLRFTSLTRIAQDDTCPCVERVANLPNTAKLAEPQGVWPLIEPHLRNLKRPAQYIGGEYGSVHKPDADFDFCLFYAELYHAEVPSVAARTLCNVVNAVEGMWAQRAVLPQEDMAAIMRAENIPLFSLEGKKPLKEFDVLEIIVPVQMSITGALECLSLANIELHANDRLEEDPLVVLGGLGFPNCEPLAAFFDIFAIGEGEEALPEMLQLVRSLKQQGATRAEILYQVALTPGFYVPSLYAELDEQQAQESGSWVRPLHPELPCVIEKCISKSFSSSPAAQESLPSFVKLSLEEFSVEVIRGCAHGCRFCNYGMALRPVRERSAQNISNSIASEMSRSGFSRVVLYALSATDHSEIGEVLTDLNTLCRKNSYGTKMLSQRLDNFSDDLAEVVLESKTSRNNLVFAIEAGTQRLRDFINKNVTEEDFFNAVNAAFSRGLECCTLLCIVGLPTETDEDIIALADLVKRGYERACEVTPVEDISRIHFVLTCSLFTPFPYTPFQWDEQISASEAKRRVDLLKELLDNDAIKINFNVTQWLITATLMRGGRDMSHLIEEAWLRGACNEGWTGYCKEQCWFDAANTLGFDFESLATKRYPLGTVLPWDHISMGVSREFLIEERKRADRGLPTPDCTLEGCSNCGVCSRFKVKNDLAQARTS